MNRDKLTDRLWEIRHELMKIYDQEMKGYSSTELVSIHETIKALYQSESIIKERI